MKNNARVIAGRNRAKVLSSPRTNAVGIKDGVAGSWVTPNYIKSQGADYTPGTRQHFEKVAVYLNRSIDSYKRDLNKSYG